MNDEDRKPSSESTEENVDENVRKYFSTVFNDNAHHEIFSSQ
jgi:hypothetical protein